MSRPSSPAMDLATWVWPVTLAGLSAIVVADFVIISRRPREPTMRESTAWVSVYLTLATAFGLAIWWGWSPRYAGEFFAGWLTEYSLSVDNLFVFVIIMARFAVPREAQQKVLGVGIAL